MHVCHMSYLFESIKILIFIYLYVGLYQFNFFLAELDTMIQKLIINRCLPFSLVEYSEFKSILQTGYPKLKILSRPTLMKRIDSNTISMKKNLKKELSFLKHISTTADCWSIFKKFVF